MERDNNKDILHSKEKIETKVFDQSNGANKYVARQIADLVKTQTNRPVVIGLSTGSVKGVYRELARIGKEESLSFASVIVFNVDEYYPIQKNQLQSHHRFLKDNLFDNVNISADKIHTLDGTVPSEKLSEYCQSYDDAIQKYGGVDIQILAIGKGGRIGFNEPGSSRHSKTRVVHLDRQTRKDLEGVFFGIESVPKQAITLGVGTILSARKIFVMAFGEDKASIVAKTVEGSVTAEIISSYIQQHNNAEVIVDAAAARALTRLAAPWTLIPTSSNLKLDWNDFKNVKKAVIHLSLHTKKSVLKLREEDYISNSLEQLLDARGPAHTLNLTVFQALKETITGWPGGKPTAEYLKMSPEMRASTLKLETPHGTTTRNPTDYIVHNYKHISTEGNPKIDPVIYPKRVIIFSPHPDDDVISMGGTLIRLVEQGHLVSIAYQTSGNYAVWDDDVKRFSNFARRFSEIFGLDSAKLKEMEDKIKVDIDRKASGTPDTPEVRKIKGLIRETEATSGARYCGVKEEDIYFLNLPFYESGTEKKNELSSKDVDIITNLLEKVKPHQIYAAGDLSDPHGTHRVCLKALFKSLKQVASKDWFKHCQVWLYRGAWQEWEPHEITMAIPMSPNELLQKRYAIYKHQSQKDPPPFPGSDPREFWQRSEARNRETAKIYDTLGMPDYEGVEAFVLYDPATMKI